MFYDLEYVVCLMMCLRSPHFVLQVTWRSNGGVFEPHREHELEPLAGARHAKRVAPEDRITVPTAAESLGPDDGRP